MENSDAGAFISLIMIVLVACAACLTKDSDDLKLEVIESMVKKCDSNGGLDYIEHDYDVKCKNGAEFSFDRFTKQK